MNSASITVAETPKQDVDVKFEFRFSRVPNRHREELKAREALVRDFALKIQRTPRIESIELYQVERVGDSGSQVFYVDVYRKDVSPVHYVAKFQNIKNTAREARGAYNANERNMCPVAYCFPILAEEAAKIGPENDDKLSTSEIGLIVYQLTKLRDPSEFREVFLNEKISSAGCAKAIENLYQRFPNLEHQESNERTFAEDFKRYLRPGVDPLSRVKALEQSSLTCLEALAGSITKTNAKINSSDFDFKFKGIAVHGDLHARNLMVDKDRWDFDLIDFDWMHYGHPAKDFVVLEATLKYMLLPELVRKMKTASGVPLPYLPTRVIEELTNCWYVAGLLLPSEDEVKERLAHFKLIHEHIEAILRMHRCLAVLRQQANVCMKKFADIATSCSADHHYYLSLFLVTLGLVGYSQTDLTWAMIGLDKLTKQFQELL